jgi:hypothetical protein
MRKNRRFCLQVFDGDTVENLFSDVETSQKTWQSYMKFFNKTNFRKLLHRLLRFQFLARQLMQDFKKIMNNQNFIAIHKNELHCLANIRQNNSFFKTIDRKLNRNNATKLRFFQSVVLGRPEKPIHNTTLDIIRVAPGKFKAGTLNLIASLGRMVQVIPVLCQAGYR